MSLIELFLLAVGLSMDAFAVSVCKGLSMQTMRLKHAFVIGLYFGGFQALMPWLGYLLGIRFQGAIKPMTTGLRSSCLASLALTWSKNPWNRTPNPATRLWM